MVNAHHKEVADVYVEDGIIASIGPNIVVRIKLAENLSYT